MSERFTELKNLVLQQFELYYLRTHHGLSLGPQGLASILAKPENLNESDATPANQRSERVCIGSRVRLLDLEDNSKTETKLVLPGNSAPPSGPISIVSPLWASFLKLEPAKYIEVRIFARPLRVRVL